MILSRSGRKEGGRNGPKRRRAPRHPFIADAEVIEIASDTKLNAKTSDLGIDVCFLDVFNPSRKTQRCESESLTQNKTFTAVGRVVFVFPNIGMGAVFMSVEANQLAVPGRMALRIELWRIREVAASPHGIKCF